MDLNFFQISKIIINLFLKKLFKDRTTIYYNFVQLNLLLIKLMLLSHIFTAWIHI